MFTGLIQDVGTIVEVRQEGQACHLEIATHLSGGLREGDSLAVNGPCLTVTSRGTERVRATAVAETLARTTLGRLRRGDRVHLEPALAVGDPLGGHLVQGHVDGVGAVRATTRRGVSVEVSIGADAEVLRYVVAKGSIAIDGVSLTVAALDEATFTVALVPHTLSMTTLGDRRAGDAVNLEVDILAKYVERMIAPWREGGAGDGGGAGGGGGAITEGWLRERGF